VFALYPYQHFSVPQIDIACPKAMPPSLKLGILARPKVRADGKQSSGK
jgi:hypothetical protein